MKAKATHDFLHDQLGPVREGAEIELTAAQAASVLDYIDVYETKVVRPEPTEPKGKRAK